MKAGKTANITVQYWGRTGSGDAMDIARLEPDGSAALMICSDQRQRNQCVRMSVSIVSSHPQCVTQANFSSSVPETDGRPLVERLLYPTLPARYVAQAWVNDYAIAVDDGAFFFDAFPVMCNFTAKDLVEALNGSGDWDALASGQTRAEAHSGPFEIYPDLDELFLLLRCYTGDALLDKDDSTTWGRITPELWTLFCDRVAAVRASQQKGLKDHPLHLGHGFFLADATSQKATWTRAIPAGIAQEISIANSPDSTGRDLTPRFLATVTLSASWTGPVVLSNIGPSCSLVDLRRQALVLSEQHIEDFSASQAAELGQQAAVSRERGG